MVARHALQLSTLALVVSGCAPDEREAGSARSGIVGGALDTRRYPVALRYEHSEAPGQFFLRCSASLIGKHTVLTAGHCVSEGKLPLPTEVIFGADVDEPEVIVPIASFVRHPDYALTQDEVVADIAVIELASAAPEQPAGLLRQTMPAGQSSSYVGPDITFVGYGDTFFGAKDYGQRRAVGYPMFGVGPMFIQGYVLEESDWLWLAPEMAEATCNGDSGGPAYFVVDGVERQIGVHSTSNCETGGTDTRTDQWMIDAFIQQHLDQFEQGDPCRGDGHCEPSCQSGPELIDPDCAPEHCSTDGVCARACVSPLDVDCGWGQSFCSGQDAVCNTECAELDSDCEPFCAPDGVCGAACAADLDCSAEDEGGAGVGQGAPNGDAEVRGGGGCRVRGGASEGAWPWLAAWLLGTRRRHLPTKRPVNNTP